MVEVVARSPGSWMSSGTTNAIFSEVVGFEQSAGSLSNVTLKETQNGKMHSFPVRQIKVCPSQLLYHFVGSSYNTKVCVT